MADNAAAVAKERTFPTSARSGERTLEASSLRYDGVGPLQPALAVSSPRDGHSLVAGEAPDKSICASSGPVDVEAILLKPLQQVGLFGARTELTLEKLGAGRVIPLRVPQKGRTLLCQKNCACPDDGLEIESNENSDGCRASGDPPAPVTFLRFHRATVAKLQASATGRYRK